MKKIRVGLIIGATIIIIGELIILDYGNLTGFKNLGSYLGILGMLGLICGLILSIRHDKTARK